MTYAFFKRTHPKISIVVRSEVQPISIADPERPKTEYSWRPLNLPEGQFLAHYGPLSSSILQLPKGNKVVKADIVAERI